MSEVREEIETSPGSFVGRDSSGVIGLKSGCCGSSDNCCKEPDEMDKSIPDTSQVDGTNHEIRAALEEVAGFINGDVRMEVHCLNPNTGEVVLVYGNREEVEMFIASSDDSAKRRAVVRKVLRVTATVGAIAAAVSLVTLGVTGFFRNRK